ncbi:MAG: stage III sporulation protein AE, partial [Clostridiaceae bacterium]|nr:stage III sporulation protein AE [Clostridiaceae bacterium]
MKKILVIILLLLLCLPISVQATEIGEIGKTGKIGEIGQVEQNEINNLYDYITKIKTENEMLNDMDPGTFVKGFLRTGENGLSFKRLSNYVIRFAFKEVLASMQLIGSLMIIAIVCALL